jgi:mannitol-specific phosphotransferase system IIBC component
MDHNSYQGLKAGTAGGVLFTVIMNIHVEDLLKTALVAAIGASVSFTISLLLGQLVKWYKQRITKKQ